ncbi:YraN family protein [Paracandidimonas lactea]|uniref:YraN family protein n=1 Tax=Paracandidimonas lactea TaxID=2895524 RepID=UPI0019263D2A|nr:YraN family protein [Paracandidimonas lactea]
MPSDAHIDLPYTLAAAACARTARARRRKAARARKAALAGPPEKPGCGVRHPAYMQAANDAPATVCGTTPAHSPTQQVGARCEDLARRHLETHGLTILGQNLGTRRGELDLAADDAGTLVFIEVRYRRSASHGGAAASVTPHKQARLVRAAQAWLPALVRCCYGGRTPPCRFDVISLDAGKAGIDAATPDTATIQWIRDAFRLS